MHQSIVNRGQRRVLVPGVLPLVIVVVLLLAVTAPTHSRFNSHDIGSNQSVVTTDTSRDVNALSSAQRLESELVTLRSFGLEPNVLRRPAGRFLLILDNRSNLEDVFLQLADAAGSTIHDIRLSRNKSRWRQMLDLAPGRYVLRETNHPRWQCQIVLER